MASSKAKVGVHMETNAAKENKSSGNSSAGETSLTVRMYSLDELDTIATVGEAPLEQLLTICTSFTLC